jgi:hypothetical protein
MKAQSSKLKAEGFKPDVIGQAAWKCEPGGLFWSLLMVSQKVDFTHSVNILGALKMFS